MQLNYSLDDLQPELIEHCRHLLPAACRNECRQWEAVQQLQRESEPAPSSRPRQQQRPSNA
eukprot:101610-Rhodomonas_salina.1